MKTFKLIVLATILAAAPACKKKPKDAPPPVVSIDAATDTGSDTGSAGSGSDTGSAAAGSDTGSAGSGSDAGSAAAAATLPAEYVLVEGWHKEPNPKDPVVVHFEKFTVTKATFDPAKIEGGKATIEVDLTSLKTDSPKRDGHLKTADYLDTAKFASLVIDIDNVKKKEGSTYTADAKIKLRGVDKKYPVTFEVVEAKDDWIKVKGEHKFARTDFKVGRALDVKDEGVAQDLVVKIQMTLKKT